MPKRFYKFLYKMVILIIYNTLRIYIDSDIKTTPESINKAINTNRKVFPYFRNYMAFVPYIVER